MTSNYQKLWGSMNELESVTSKICSAREILECAMIALENHKYDKAEALMYAVDEFLQYYLQEFDEKFKVAWKETVVKSKMAPSAVNFPGEQYTEEELNAMCDAAEKG
jgi:DNA-directed RNA polymerase specialized sigma54-like protein